MRFNFEVAITGSLTTNNLNTFADKMLSSDELLFPIRYDEYVLNNQSYKDNSKLLTDFKKLLKLDKKYIASGIADSEVILKNIIDSNISSVIEINSSEVFLNTSRMSIDSNDFIDVILNEDADGYLYYDITNFSNPYLIIFTLQTTFELGTTVKKYYNFVPFKDSLKNTFRQETTEFQYTIHDNKVYLNTDKKYLTYSRELTEKTFTNTYFLPEFPVIDDESFLISGMVNGTTKSIYTIGNGLFGGQVTISAPQPYDLALSGTIAPIISIKKVTSREGSFIGPLDVRYNKCNFENGTISLIPKFGSRNIPASLTIQTNKNPKEMVSNDVAKIWVNLTDNLGLPIPSTDIDLEIIEGSASFIKNGTKVETLTTSSSGRVDTIIKNTLTARSVSLSERSVYQSKTRFTINEPINFRKNPDGSIKTDSIFTYFILSGDDLLPDGRKVAYVRLSMGDSNKAVSKFVKPATVTVIGNTTTITYSYEIPSDAMIVGYWILWEEDILVRATTKDLEPVEIVFNTRYIKSEDPIMLSDTKVDVPTSFDDYSYLTITEYIKNPFGLCGFSYLCIFSNCIDQKCNNPNISIRENFIFDKTISGCQHTPENEKNKLLKLSKCPGLEAQLINPFTLPLKQYIGT
jgi:hypothetical protein